MNPTIQRMVVTPRQALRTENVVLTGNTYCQICAANDQRQYVYFENNGLTRLWYGVSLNVSTGPTGANIGQLDVNSQKSLYGYGGPLYARTVGASNADTHVIKVLEY